MTCLIARFIPSMNLLNHPYSRWAHLFVCLFIPFFTLSYGDGLPLSMTQSADFVGSGNCASCHSTMQDAANHDVSIDTHWRSTMMANSAKDPLWQAKVESEVTRNPHLKSVIEDKCATCHMPMARTQAKTLGLPVEILDDGFLNSGHPLHQLAMDGVSCSACHQITDQGLGEEASFSGHYVIDTSTDAPDRVIYGPYTSPFTNQMRNNIGFTPVHGSHIGKSALCATCHTLETPYVDSTGLVKGTFPEQMTYLEWEHSQFNGLEQERMDCQDCHMPTADGGVVLSNRGGRGLNLPARSPFSQHHFVGGNEFMLKLMSDNGDALKLTTSSQQLEDTRLRLISQMESATARLSVSGVRAGPDRIDVGLRISSLVGHKFPSGFPSRRAWIHFKATDKDGQTVFESGTPDQTGNIIGNDADETLGSCEPHHTAIWDSQQVQIYESIMEDTDGNLTYTLLRGASYRKDNRLLPAGFDRTTADERIQVFGKATSDDNFIGGQDGIVYSIPRIPEKGPFTIEIKLYYQSVSAAFVNDLKSDPGALVDRFAHMYDAADKTPVTVATLAFALDPADFYQLAVAPTQPSRGLQLEVTGPIGNNVQLEMSPDLQNWELMHSFQQTTNPSIIEDSGGYEQPHRFYQLRWPLQIENVSTSGNLPDAKFGS